MFAEGRAYVAFDAHRSDDDAPYLYVTDDFGQTWKSITGNLPTGSTRCLREDVKNPNLLYCGTEFALYVSLNRGSTWTKINNNLPTVAVHEVAVHPTAGEIVAATHGRSLWILDITALRQMASDKIKDEADALQAERAGPLATNADPRPFRPALHGRKPATGRARLLFPAEEGDQSDARVPRHRR